MSHGPYQKKYLVSPADMEQLVEQYKGTLMENSRLTHAARLAAKQHVLLASPDIPPAIKKIRVKALGPEVRRTTKRVRTMNLPGAGGAAGADDDEFAKGPMETFLKTPIKSSTPQPKGRQTTATGSQATPKGKPKIPPKPAFLTPLPEEDWEQELALPIPSTSKSKGTSTLSKGKSPSSTKKKTRFSFHLPNAPKELEKLKRQPGWSEWGEKVQRKLHGKDYQTPSPCAAPWPPPPHGRSKIGRAKMVG